MFFQPKIIWWTSIAPDRLSVRPSTMARNFQEYNTSSRKDKQTDFEIISEKSEE
jgi:hypothetical protein